jgi:hypothetical protein
MYILNQLVSAGAPLLTFAGSRRVSPRTCERRK